MSHRTKIIKKGDNMDDKCENCIVGNIRGENITSDRWPKAFADMKKLIHEFETSKRALPHPGFAVRFNYCPECGHEIEKDEEYKPMIQG
jgi:hypothetical protein